MKDSHDIYLKTDVLLLADVFEKYRNICIAYYWLDPCHYFSSPGLSCNAMLKMKDIKLDLIPDINMYHFIEKSMRGAVSYIPQNYSKTANTFMKSYDKASKCIIYEDQNNSCRWAMSQYLFDANVFRKVNPESRILEVNLEYPGELHNLHNDYPLVSENIEIKERGISD